MRILFFQPTLYQNNQFDTFGPRIPFGIALNIAMLSEEHAIKVLDQNVEKKTITEIISEIKIFQPDVVGISAIHVVQYNHSFKQIIDSNACKYPKVVIGGISYKWFAKEIMSQHPHIDFCILNEGETKFQALIQTNFQQIEEIPEIVFRNNCEINFTQKKYQPLDLNLLPFPAYHAFEIKKYGRQLFHPTSRILTLPFELSRGCPNHCSFCDVPRKFNGFRTKKAEIAFEQIITLVNKYNVKYLELMDSNFLSNHKEIIKLAQMLIEAKIKVKFLGNVSINEIIRFPDLQLLYNAGFEYLQLGLETTDQNFLSNHSKSFNQANDFLAWNKKLQQIGFFIQYTMITGQPQTTRQQVLNDYRFLKQLSPHFFSFFYYTPFFEILSGNVKVESTLSRSYDELSAEKRCIDNKFISTKELERTLKKVKILLFIHIILKKIGKKHFMTSFKMILYVCSIGLKNLFQSHKRSNSDEN